MSGYDVFAPFYDATDGGAPERATYVRTLLERHHPEARALLELACGTGSVLEQLQGDYDVSGVDVSEGMLAVAARKVPSARLVREDMTRVRLGEIFDVVLCVFDSINHLLTFGQWEATFDRAREHLAAGGVFVFDANTERKLSRFAAAPPFPQWFEGDSLLLIDVAAGGEGIYVWHLKVFEHVHGPEYRLHAVDLPQAVFPADRIRAALAERFRRVRVYDAERARPSGHSERLHFVCTA